MDEVCVNPPLTSEDLRDLVARARRQSPDAWEQLYRHLRPKLVDYARRRLPSVTAAEDAVSEAFARAIAKIDDYRWEGIGFEGWMYGITRNVVLESHRAVQRSHRLDDRQAAAQVPAEADPTGDQLEASEERARVRRAFELLDDEDRELLELRVVGGLSAEQVGVVLDRTAGAVRMAQSRALDRLRVAMKGVDHG